MSTRLATTFFLFSLIFAYRCAANSAYEVLSETKQDTNIFTQGLVLDSTDLYLSSGRYGMSFIKRISSNDEKYQALPKQLFAEGITVVGDSLFLLTWKAGKLLKLNKKTLQVLQTIHYEGEGWGLTHNHDSFFMSDGSHYIQRRDLNDFSLQSYLRVTHKGKALKKINELEYAEGFLWANVWFSNKIYKIEPSSGEVVGVWDLSELKEDLALSNRESVLNGIAFDKARDAFWVTGKLWPKRFLIRFKSSERDDQHSPN